MGLFDRLFGRQKEEKPVENIPEEAVETVSEDDQGKNLEKVETAPVENTQSENLDEQTFQTELKERLANDETRLETIQEKVEEMEPETATTGSSLEFAENDLQAPENHTLQTEMRTPQPDETAAFSQHTTHPVATDLQARLAEARRQQAEQENMRQLNKANVESTTAEKTISEPVEASSSIQEETVQEKYDRSLKKTRTGFGARLNAFFANFRSVEEEFFE